MRASSMGAQSLDCMTRHVYALLLIVSPLLPQGMLPPALRVATAAAVRALVAVTPVLTAVVGMTSHRLSVGVQCQRQQHRHLPRKRVLSTTHFRRCPSHRSVAPPTCSQSAAVHAPLLLPCSRSNVHALLHSCIALCARCWLVQIRSSGTRATQAATQDNRMKLSSIHLSNSPYILKQAGHREVQKHSVRAIRPVAANRKRRQ